MKKLLAICCFCVSMPLFAATETHVGVAQRILLSDGEYGNCMAFIVPNLADTSLDCSRSGWVTFSCSGDFNSKAAGSQKLQAAQLSYVTGNQLFLVLDDNRKHSNYCFAARVDAI